MSEFIDIYDLAYRPDLRRYVWIVKDNNFEWAITPRGIRFTDIGNPVDTPEAQIMLLRILRGKNVKF